MKRVAFYRWICGAIGLLVVVSLLASAQATGGRIFGTVTDPTGAVVPRVKLTLLNEATGISRTTESDVGGNYLFIEVPVGTYTVESEASGFKKNVRRGVIVQVNQGVHLDLVMELGLREEVIEVTGGAPLVDTSSTQIGAVVNETAAVGLPLSSRDTYQLLQLQPGVQAETGTDLFFGSDRPGVVSVNGGRGRANNFTVNGGEGNDLFANLPAVQPSPDTIAEFRVLTNTFDAEFGRNSGAIVNVVTKSGTNDWHGSAYEFFRNRKLNARGFFDLVKPDFKQNQFGGTFGGPFVRNKSFFFASYEGQRLRRGISGDVVRVPTALERGGDFNDASGLATTFAGAIADQLIADILVNRPGCLAAITAGAGAMPVAGEDYANIFPTNGIPVECFDPVAFDLMQQFVPPANIGAELFQGIPVSRERDDQFTGRADHQFSDSQNLSVYYFFADRNIFQPFSRFQAGGAALPGFGAITRERIQQLNIALASSLAPTKVNEFRFTYLREAQDDFLHPERTHLVTDSCTGAVASFCFTGTEDSGQIAPNPMSGITPGLGADREGVPFISVDGSFSIGNNLEGELPQTGNTYHFQDNFSWVRGRHSLKFGGDLRWNKFDQFLFFDVNGQYNYFGGGPNDPILLTDEDGDFVNTTDDQTQNLLPNYLLGLPDFYLQGGAQLEAVRYTSLYLFAQDSWKIHPNLTLNYGLRWEFTQPLHDKFDRIQTFRRGEATTNYPCELDPSFSAGLIAGPDGVLGTGDDLGTDCDPGSALESVFPLGLVTPGDPLSDGSRVPNGLTQTYYHAWAPRIGLAWSPEIWPELFGGPNKTVIRMGWGIFYNPVEQLVLEQFSAEPPFGGSSGLFNPLFSTPFVLQDGSTLPNPFGGILDPPVGEPVDWARFRPILLFGQFQPDMRPQYSVQYNFGFERELSSNLVFKVNYVGTQGHRLLATFDLNFGNPQTCLDLQNISDLTGDDSLACGPFFADSFYFIPAGTIPAGETLTLPYGSVPSVTGPNLTDITLVGLRPFSSPLCEPTTGNGCPPDGVPVFSSIFTQHTIANSSYNALQASVEKRWSGGLQFLGAYSWSKCIDQASSFENILNPFDHNRSRALCAFHAEHRFVFSYVWEIPFKSLFPAAPRRLRDGWQITGVTTFQTGFPIRITSEDDLELQGSFDFELPGQPDLVGDFVTFDPRDNPNHLFFDPSAFAPQALGTIGNAPRTICCGPGINNFDFAVLKDTVLTERVTLQFRAEFFNIFNHAQFVNPEGSITAGEDFGRVLRVRDPRLIQFALKLLF